MDLAIYSTSQAMLNESPLKIIKIIHTSIWLGFNAILIYLCYAVVVNRIDQWVWLGIGAVVLEGLVLIAFKFVCPLTLIARRYSDSRKDNFDIYLPVWLARNTKLIYSTLFGIIACILIYRILSINS